MSYLNYKTEKVQIDNQQIPTQNPVDLNGIYILGHYQIENIWV